MVVHSYDILWLWKNTGGKLKKYIQDYFFIVYAHTSLIKIPPAKCMNVSYICMCRCAYVRKTYRQTEMVQTCLYICPAEKWTLSFINIWYESGQVVYIDATNETLENPLDTFWLRKPNLDNESRGWVGKTFFISRHESWNFSICQWLNCVHVLNQHAWNIPIFVPEFWGRLWLCWNIQCIPQKMPV